MASRRFFRFGVAVAAGSVLIGGCGAAGRPTGNTASNAPSTSARRSEPATSRRPGHKERPAFPERRPPANVRAPMKGEPAEAALAEARLVPTSCSQVQTADSDVIVKEMRSAVDASFKEWHDEQPACWEEMREEYRMTQESRAYGSAAGVSGGIALGAVGTIGHGSGTGVGYGSAGGRMSPKAEPQKAQRASTTNNQVASVDEADIVKTDGRYVYFAANGAMRIAEALHPKLVSVTKVTGTVRDLFVEGNRAVVYTSLGATAKPCTYAYDCTFGGDGSSTSVKVYDITDRAAPKLTRTIDLSGSLIAARRIGNTVHTVVADGDVPKPPYETWPPDFEMCGTPEAAVRQKFAKLKVDNEKAIRARLTSAFPIMSTNGTTQPLCNGLLRTPIRDGQAFTTLMSFDLADDGTAPSSATIQSRPGAVFASADSLYFAVTHSKARTSGGRWYSYYAPSVNEVSEIHKFHIGASPKETRYVGSGTVPGHVLNQFAMDEWYGYLRVATTKGRVPAPGVESAVSILAQGEHGNLVRVGAVEKIAPGEDIRAVRFDDDRGYVVTFKKTDPLFVLDLFEPSRPQILGELEIPGFSTYIHRIDPNHLLSIGFDANDHGNFAYFDGVILQLFDVKKPTEPKLLHKEKIGSRGSSSEAATDHLAFNYFASEGLLAVPMTICEGGGDGVHGDRLAFSGLLVYDVDVERGFTRLGGVEHGTKGVSCATWWSHANSAVKRSVFLDDLVYSIADDRAKVQRLDRLGVDVADLSLMP